MAVNLGKWPSKRGRVSKIIPSVGSGSLGVGAVVRFSRIRELSGKCRLRTALALARTSHRPGGGLPELTYEKRN